MKHLALAAILMATVTSCIFVSKKPDASPTPRDQTIDHEAPPPSGGDLTRAFRQDGETCPDGTRSVSVAEASDATDQLCGLLEEWDIAKLDGGGSMSGPGYNCEIKPSDDRGFGHSLCTP